MTDKPRYWTPRYWKPLTRLKPGETYLRIEVVRETMQHYGIDEDTAREMLAKEHAKSDLYVNDLYQVQVMQCGPENLITHICVRRRDGGTNLRDWRHFQQIKNEICGPEREGFELYPAESRKVDTSNKWHIWVLPEGTHMEGIGWLDRDVQYDERRDVPGLRQRAL